LWCGLRSLTGWRAHPIRRPRPCQTEARHDGTVRAGRGIAAGRIGPLTRLRCVDAIVSGPHEPETSHYELLRAFQDDEVLGRMETEPEARGYRTHEFGDSVLLERGAAWLQLNPS
jgi:S-adenosylmethionine:tRNA ribosyltransferase-isomerase